MLWLGEFVESSMFQKIRTFTNCMFSHNSIDMYWLCYMYNEKSYPNLTWISKPWNFAQGKTIMNSKSLHKIHIFALFMRDSCIHISFAWQSIHWDSHAVKYTWIKNSHMAFVCLLIYTCISREIPVWYWLAQLDLVQVQICLQFWH